MSQIHRNVFEVLRGRLCRLVFLLFVLVGLEACSGFFFMPMKQHVRTPDQIKLEYENVWFKSVDGLDLHAWFLPAQGESKGSVFFLHGNAENISTHIGSVYWLPREGFNVFLFDYRGYGKSAGIPTFAGAISDAESALAMLLDRKDIDPDKVVVFGQSLGGSIAVNAVAKSAYRQNIKALIIESAFADYHMITRDVLARFWLTWPFQWPLSFLIDNGFSPLQVVADVAPIPLLIIHSEKDQIVPYGHGQQLYNAAAERKQIWIVPSARHIEATKDLKLRSHLVDYMESVLK